jgi:hypothetical protein
MSDSESVAAMMAAPGGRRGRRRSAFDDLDTVRGTATSADGVINLAFNHDFARDKGAAAYVGDDTRPGLLADLQASFARIRVLADVVTVRPAW